jgi:hypothetical protein
MAKKNSKSFLIVRDDDGFEDCASSYSEAVKKATKILQDACNREYANPLRIYQLACEVGLPEDPIEVIVTDLRR